MRNNDITLCRHMIPAVGLSVYTIIVTARLFATDESIIVIDATDDPVDSGATKRVTFVAPARVTDVVHSRRHSRPKTVQSTSTQSENRRPKSSRGRRTVSPSVDDRVKQVLRESGLSESSESSAAPSPRRVETSDAADVAHRWATASDGRIHEWLREKRELGVRARRARRRERRREKEVAAAADAVATQRREASGIAVVSWMKQKRSEARLLRRERSQDAALLAQATPPSVRPHPPSDKPHPLSARSCTLSSVSDAPRVQSAREVRDERPRPPTAKPRPADSKTRLPGETPTDSEAKCMCGFDDPERVWVTGETKKFSERRTTVTSRGMSPKRTQSSPIRSGHAERGRPEAVGCDDLAKRVSFDDWLRKKEEDKGNKRKERLGKRLKKKEDTSEGRNSENVQSKSEEVLGVDEENCKDAPVDRSRSEDSVSKGQRQKGAGAAEVSLTLGVGPKNAEKIQTQKVKSGSKKTAHIGRTELGKAALTSGEKSEGGTSKEAEDGKTVDEETESNEKNTQTANQQRNGNKLKSTRKKRSTTSFVHKPTQPTPLTGKTSLRVAQVAPPVGAGSKRYNAHRVKHQRESWDNFAGHIWQKLNDGEEVKVKDESGEPRPEPQGSDKPDEASSCDSHSKRGRPVAEDAPTEGATEGATDALVVTASVSIDLPNSCGEDDETTNVSSSSEVTPLEQSSDDDSWPEAGRIKDGGAQPIEEPADGNTQNILVLDDAVSNGGVSNGNRDSFGSVDEADENEEAITQDTLSTNQNVTDDYFFDENCDTKGSALDGNYYDDETRNVDSENIRGGNGDAEEIQTKRDRDDDVVNVENAANNQGDETTPVTTADEQQDTTFLTQNED